MALSILGNSSNAIPNSAFISGAIVNSAVGYNVSISSKLFSSYNVYEEVPGQLRATITPKAVGNIMVLHAHLHWGGWYDRSSVDVGVNFRVRKSYDNGSTWVEVGPSQIGTSSYITGSAAGYAPAACHTGCYKYNKGNANFSNEKDSLLVHDIVTNATSTIYAVHWGCGYAPTSRTIYWNRGVNFGSNLYNPTHTCTLTATEVKR
jgi:hypothetical protein